VTAALKNPYRVAWKVWDDPHETRERWKGSGYERRLTGRQIVKARRPAALVEWRQLCSA
jgi:response regulator RpfG family c-di-GMP phosphodiesterase